jgi:hypothetical protein
MLTTGFFVELRFELKNWVLITNISIIKSKKKTKMLETRYEPWTGI